MALQFNLLPDVKLEFNQQQHLKRLVMMTSALAVTAALALFILSFVVVDILQKQLINNANNDIKTYSAKLQAIPNLSKVLTIQNQLNALPNLHQQKHIVSRLYTYMPRITPTNVNIGQLSLDSSANTVEIQGTADTIQSVNKFVDTLKFTNYTTGGSQKPAFSNVVLTSVDRADDKATYTISFSFDPALFSATQNVQLAIPQETTTRSVIDSPDPASLLFNGQTAKPKTSDQQGGQ